MSTLWSVAAKYLIGAAILAGLLFGLWTWGNSRESDGYARRDTEAKIELGKRQAALYQEQMKNEELRIETDRRQQELKAATAAVIAERSVSARLRKLTANGVSTSGSTVPPGGTDGARADWLGGFAACYAEYELLGNDYSRAADKLRGLQDFIDPPAR